MLALGTCHDIIYSPTTHTKFIANNTTNRCRVSFTVPADGAVADASAADIIGTVLVLGTCNDIIYSLKAQQHSVENTSN